MSTLNPSAINVAVLAGGWSDEREISLASGRACQKALQEAGFAHVDLIDVANEQLFSQLQNGDYNVAFPAMHGAYGEDGCIQGLLEILHIPYAFSGVLASAMGTEKEISKIMYRNAQIPTPNGVVFEEGSVPTSDELDSVVEQLGLPLFVKPASNGSSYGITRVTKRENLKQAVCDAQTGATRVLIEECITGTEITVPVIGNDNPEALPVVEIVTGADFYDLQVKYEPSELHHVIPARISQESYKKAQEYAVKAHKTLGCLGCSRSDFIVTKNGEPIILETNTIPGMTETSLLPDSAKHAGISFSELCTRFVELALKKHGKA